ncbi:MAG: hypothetical protein ACOYWZ_20690 [Bacillota bacterium]
MAMVTVQDMDGPLECMGDTVTAILLGIMAMVTLAASMATVRHSDYTEVMVDIRLWVTEVMDTASTDISTK